MSITAATLVARIRAKLGDEPWEDTLSGAYTAASGTASFTNATQLAEGDRAEVDDGGGNILRIKATPSGNPVSVKGGHNGTTDTNASNGAVILKNPEFEYNQISDAIKRAIDALWPWAWIKRTETITFVTGQHLYPITSTTFLEPIALVQDVTVTAGLYKALYYGRDGGYPFSVQRDLPATIAANGYALYIPTVRMSPTTTATLSYASLISSTPSAGSYADMSDGLLAEAVVLEACAILLENYDVLRVTEDVEHGDTGINPGQRTRQAAWFRQKADQVRRQYNLYLKRTEPIAAKWVR